MRVFAAGMALALVLASAALAQSDEAAPTTASVLDAASDEDWVTLDQRDLLYLFIDDGVVVFELARDFAPAHIANVDRLTDARYFDGLAILRSQDNYVVQWGDPAAGTAAARAQGGAATRLDPEFYRPLGDLAITSIDSRDAYADTVGFVDGMPVASDGERVWLAHCYGMLGAGRANAPDSGSGAELYVVTGHAPRHLDRNVTLLGRAVHGLDKLSALPRGTGPLGFYEDEAEHVPIEKLRFGDELPADEQIELARLRTDTRTFERLVEARRNRVEEWFVDPAGRIELCNVPIPVRRLGE